LPGDFIHCDVTDQNALTQLGKFDLVYSYGVLHHFPGMREHLENISTVLNPGAELRFMVYARNSWKYAMIQKGLDQFEAQAGCPYADAYTKEEITELYKACLRLNVSDRIIASCITYQNTNKVNLNWSLGLKPWNQPCVMLSKSIWDGIC
jgi:SAM-dependent methyltransferase